jgi:hypothetical protein
MGKMVLPCPLQEATQLTRFLVKSRDERMNANAEAAWGAELVRRMAEIRSGKDIGEPAGKVFAERRKQDR